MSWPVIDGTGLGKMTAAERHVWRVAYAAACSSHRSSPLNVAFEAVAELRLVVNHRKVGIREELVEAAREAMGTE